MTAAARTRPAIAVMVMTLVWTAVSWGAGTMATGPRNGARADRAPWHALTSAAQAQEADLTIAGGDAVELAVQGWIGRLAGRSVQVSYDPVGAAAARQFFVLDQVDVAITDAPFTDSEIRQLTSADVGYRYLPVLGSALSIVANPPGDVDGAGAGLQLSSDTVAGIFTARITDWSDPAIAADNPGMVLPSAPIVPVVRNDRSGASLQLSEYIIDTEPLIWSAFAAETGIPDTATDIWPPTDGALDGRGAAGVLSTVTTTDGAVGYVEASFAVTQGVEVSAVRNAAGRYVLPVPSAITSALGDAVVTANGYPDLTGVSTASEPDAYPLAGADVMVVPTEPDAATALALTELVGYVACDGQQLAASVGYAPLPRVLVQAALDGLADVDGADAPQSCDGTPETGSPTVPPPTSTTAPGPGIATISPTLPTIDPDPSIPVEPTPSGLVDDPLAEDAEVPLGPDALSARAQREASLQALGEDRRPAGPYALLGLLVVLALLAPPALSELRRRRLAPSRTVLADPGQLRADGDGQEADELTFVEYASEPLPSGSAPPTSGAVDVPPTTPMPRIADRPDQTVDLGSARWQPLPDDDPGSAERVGD